MFNGLFSRGIKCGHTTRLQTYLALIRQSKATFEGWECIIISKKLALNFCSSLILKDHRKVFFKLSVLLDSSHLSFSSPLSSLHEMSYFYLIFFNALIVLLFPPQCHHSGQHPGYPVYGGTRRWTLLRPSGKWQERREQDQPAHHLVSREWVTIYCIHTYCNQPIMQRQVTGVDAL